MRIFGLMLVKNEIDVIEYTLNQARKWADKIFILDNGSTDGTWELLQELKDDVITPWKQDTQPYRNSLRADIFNNYKHLAEEGDWWCYKMDSDEIYYENPKELLPTISGLHHVVYKKSLEYVFTKDDVEAIDFSKPFSDIVDSIKSLKPAAYLEARFFRHRDKLVWPENIYQPIHMGMASPKTIVTRHYQFRSPKQMQARLDLRNAIPRDKRGKPFRHVTEKNWEELLLTSDKVIRDDPKKYNSIPTYGNFREPFLKRVIKTLLHLLKIWP